MNDNEFVSEYIRSEAKGLLFTVTDVVEKHTVKGIKYYIFTLLASENNFLPIENKEFVGKKTSFSVFLGENGIGDRILYMFAKMCGACVKGEDGNFNLPEGFTPDKLKGCLVNADVALDKNGKYYNAKNFSTVWVSKDA